jgi:hypothetical protein
VTPDKPAGQQIAIPAASTLTASRRVVPLAIVQQPRVDNPPLVASPRLKIQERGPRILQLEKSRNVSLPVGPPDSMECV